MGYTSGTKVGTEWHSGNNVGNPIRLGAFTQISSPSDGNLTLMNNAGTGFTMLQFGGVGAGFIGLRYGGTTLDVKSADNGGFARFRAGSFTAINAAAVTGAGQIDYGATVATTVGAAGAAAALPATPTGYIIINVGGTTQKVPYYN